MTKEIPITVGDSGTSGFVVRPSDCVLRASSRGAAMLAVVMFIMISTIAITAWIQLTGARLQQTEQLETVAERHVRWQNSLAVERQDTFTWAMRDDITRAAVSTELGGGWGGATAQAYGHLSAFETKERASNATVSYPFNNLDPPGTTDGGVFFTRTDSSTDNSQTEKLTFYNYIKTYPITLLGDLFVIQKKATTATGTYSIAPNFLINGRVVIFDGTATTSGLRATTVYHAGATLTNVVKNAAGTANLLPQNSPVMPIATAGYGGTSTPSAVTDGSLNQAYNGSFAAGSLRTIITNTNNWYTGSTSSSSSTNLNTDYDGAGSSSDIQVDIQSSPTYTPPTTSPYGYTASGSLNTISVVLSSATSKHLRIVSGVEQLVLKGQTTSTSYTAAAALPPIIISVEQGTMRDVRFIGENSRPLILAFDDGAGVPIYLGFENNSLVGGGPTRWRLQMTNESRAIWINPKNANGVLITGGLRTNYQVNCVDSSTNVRVTWQRDTEPDRLAPFMPRDGWLETYLLTQ